MARINVGDVVTLTIESYTNDDEGVAWTEGFDLVIVNGINREDLVVKASVTDVNEYIIRANKLSRITGTQDREVEDYPSGPYEMDDDEEADENDEEEHL